MTTVNLPADKFDTALTFVKPDPAPTRVPLDKLAVLPGFNTRVKDSDYSERVAAIAESIVAHGFFDDKPFAVTMLPGDETVYIYDGEHRFDAAKQALLDGAEFPDGLPVAFAKDGATVKDLTIHLAHGNNGERLNMVELAAVVRRMQGLDMDKAEIAAALGRTARHIDNLFVLAGANAAVKKAVASGQIAGAEAVKLLRKDKTTAAAKITEAIKKAEEKGKAKATPKTMAAGPKMKSVPIEQSLPEGEIMSTILKTLAGRIREHVQIGDDDKLLETGMIRVRVEVIDHDAEAAAQAKAEEAEKKAAERAAAVEAKQKEREAKAKEKAEAAAKRAAEKTALAAAAKKAASAAEKKADAAKKATAVKAASGGKTRPTRRKPAESDSIVEAATPAVTRESAPSGPESGQKGQDDGMGGL